MLYKNQLRVQIGMSFKKNHPGVPFDPLIPFLSICLKEAVRNMDNDLSVKIVTLMFFITKKRPGSNLMSTMKEIVE